MMPLALTNRATTSARRAATVAGPALVDTRPSVASHSGSNLPPLAGTHRPAGLRAGFVPVFVKPASTLACTEEMSRGQIRPRGISA
jgi:hypothetical protein